MVTVYCPEELQLLDGLGNAHSHCPRVRAATTSVLIHAVMNHLTGMLEKEGTLGIETHTPCVQKYAFRHLFNNIVHICQISSGA